MFWGCLKEVQKTHVPEDPDLDSCVCGVGSPLVRIPGMTEVVDQNGDGDVTLEDAAFRGGGAPLEE